MKIWIDADACPKVIKESIFKVASRLKISVILVANSKMVIPHDSLFTLIIVGKNFDEADNYILKHSEEDDIVITADIPLASSLVGKGVTALNPRGNVYDENNIGDILSMRNLLSDLREERLVSGGPSTFSASDRVSFINSLDREITKKLKKK